MGNGNQEKLTPEQEERARAVKVQAEAMAAKAKHSVSNKGLGERVTGLEAMAAKLKEHIGL